MNSAGKPVAFVAIVLVHELGTQQLDDKNGVLHSLTIRDFSQIGPVSVGREINFPTTDGVCRQDTHSHDTFVHVQRITERNAHSRSPREHAWLKGAEPRIAHCGVS